MSRRSFDDDAAASSGRPCCRGSAHNRYSNASTRPAGNAADSLPEQRSVRETSLGDEQGNRAHGVAHPNWSLGPKISVDLGHLMNKGLEGSSFHLFRSAVRSLEVVIHPQSRDFTRWSNMSTDRARQLARRQRIRSLHARLAERRRRHASGSTCRNRASTSSADLARFTASRSPGRAGEGGAKPASSMPPTR